MHADHVIIAAPIEHTGIDFTNFDDPVTQPARQWDPLYRYIVTAEGVNMDYFTTDPDYDVPGFIAGVPGKSDGFVLCNLEATVNDTMYYSLYTTRDIINDLQDILFNPSIKFTHYWPDGFNLLSPRDVDVAPYQDVVLSPRLYNIGVMSDVMDQMEGSIIAARNAALLIRKDIQSAVLDGKFTKMFGLVSNITEDWK
ncbi:uncharacterized protein [Ptychodera flava]|uniref:uncharacterized protein n=1 Tax=Ptychodera flava TaxID=63121 RepID=UPI003969C5BE